MLLIFGLFLIFMVMSTVSAVDDNSSNLTQTNDSISAQEESLSQESEVLSFDKLEYEISTTNESQVLTLNSDYSYTSGSNKGILISKSITIDGKGHTLNGNCLSRIFNVTADNVVIKNINFINGNAWGRYFTNNVGGGAIYWSGANGILQNCSFKNNTGYGIEDDPFDKESEMTLDDGTIVHTIRFRPMGAKTNEGGAIVWNGTNGTVYKCIFEENRVGYPNSGGAICWRGNDGKIISSEFYSNYGWCGAAICWIGDDGLILFSKIINSDYFTGIYWFGNNGLIRQSLLLPSDNRPIVQVIGGEVDADYNFWGDTVKSPNSVKKLDSVKIWYLLNATHEGEFFTKGENVLVEYDINTIYDGGVIRHSYISVDFSGKINYTVPKAGFLVINVDEGNVFLKIDSKDHIVSKNLKTYYKNKITYKVRIYDVLGNVVNGKVTFKLNKKTYRLKTNKNGIATLKAKLKPGKYYVYIYYGDTKSKKKITVKSTLITKNLSKKVRKSADFKVKVLNSKGKAFKNQKVKIKFKGKLYKIKTNKKGIAIFKVPKKLKAGKYKIKTTYNGLTNTNKIIIKK